MSKKMSKKTFITVLITVATFSFAYAQDVSKNDSIKMTKGQVTTPTSSIFNGSWKGIIAGSVEFIYHFKVEGNVLTGTLDSEGETTPILKGVVSGDNISFVMLARNEKTATIGKMNGDVLVVNFTYSGMNLSGDFKKVVE